MTVRVEGHLDTGMPHLVPQVGGSLIVDDQLGPEEMRKVVEARRFHFGLPGDAFQTSASNMSGSMKPLQLPGNGNAAPGLPTFSSATIFMTLSGTSGGRPGY